MIYLFTSSTRVHSQNIETHIRKQLDSDTNISSVREHVKEYYTFLLITNHLWSEKSLVDYTHVRIQWARRKMLIGLHQWLTLLFLGTVRFTRQFLFYTRVQAPA